MINTLEVPTNWKQRVKRANILLLIYHSWSTPITLLSSFITNFSNLIVDRISFVCHRQSTTVVMVAPIVVVMVVFWIYNKRLNIHWTKETDFNIYDFNLWYKFLTYKNNSLSCLTFLLTPVWEFFMNINL